MNSERFEKDFFQFESDTCLFCTYFRKMTISDFHLPADTPLKNVQWLPCAAPGPRAIVPAPQCANYFIVEEEADGSLSTSFQGRALKGKRLDWSGRVVGVSNFQQLVLWGHDEVPLNSDSVPQALALAKVQQIIGSTRISPASVDLY